VNRRGFFAVLAAVLASRAVAQPEQKRFFITGLFHTEKLNDCTIPPIECYGTSRADAANNWLNNSGCTVWTEQEWADFQKRSGKGFEQGCAELHK
jgi:hypothetical protein